MHFIGILSSFYALCGIRCDGICRAHEFQTLLLLKIRYNSPANFANKFKRWRFALWLV